MSSSGQLQPIETSKEPLALRAFWLIRETVVPGLLFWTPSVVLHALRGNRFSNLDMVVLTAGLPTFSGICLFLIWRTWGGFRTRVHRVALPVLGVWLLGPLMITVSASFSGGGFSQAGAWQAVGVGTVFFPIFTFMMSAYDGTLGAVLLASLCLPLLAILNGPKRGGVGSPVARI